MRENAKALCDVTRKIIQDWINWRNIPIALIDVVEGAPEKPLNVRCDPGFSAFGETRLV